MTFDKEGLVVRAIQGIETRPAFGIKLFSAKKPAWKKLSSEQQMNTLVQVEETLKTKHAKQLRQLAQPIHENTHVTYGDILMKLEREPMPLANIAETVKLSKSETKAALKVLEKQKWVQQPRVRKHVFHNAMMNFFQMVHDHANNGYLTPKSSYLSMSLPEVWTSYRVNRNGFVAGLLWKEAKAGNQEAKALFTEKPSLLRKLVDWLTPKPPSHPEIYA